MSAPELFKNEEKEYGRFYKEHLLEQYKLFVQMADNISSRRQLANSFFLTLLSGLVGVLGALFSISPPGSRFNFVWVLAVSLSGIVLCAAWHYTIISYRDLNEIKFKVIHEIEERLPLSMYRREWALLQKLPKYRPLNVVERIVPWVFMAIYLATFAVFILGMYFPSV